MKYILFILALTIAVNASAQTGMQTTAKGVSYQVFTHNTGDKIKLSDVITFNVIQRTGTDSVLFSTYAAGHTVQAQIQPSQNAGDLMDIFPLLTVHDSAFIKVPTDSIFKGHDDARPPFFPKGSYTNITIKIEKVQSMNEAMAERNAELEKIKTAEAENTAKYIASHKLVLNTTPSGLKYVITKTSLKAKPLKGDTLLVNYAGRTLDDHVFDSSIAEVAKAANLQQPGRTYEPIEVVVGTGGVIPGWDEGLLLMNEGSKATFVIPSALGYGAQGQGDIKPYSTMVFDVELVKIKPTKHAVVARPGVKKPLHKKTVTSAKKN
jgi:FKBP-type peptidyl-prolyl cis-trans isomerase FkpA